MRESLIGDSEMGWRTKRELTYARAQRDSWNIYGLQVFP